MSLVKIMNFFLAISCAHAYDGGDVSRSGGFLAAPADGDAGNEIVLEATIKIKPGQEDAIVAEKLRAELTEEMNAELEKDGITAVDVRVAIIRSERGEVGRSLQAEKLFDLRITLHTTDSTLIFLKVTSDFATEKFLQLWEKLPDATFDFVNFPHVVGGSVPTTSCGCLAPNEVPETCTSDDGHKKTVKDCICGEGADAPTCHQDQFCLVDGESASCEAKDE